MHPLRHLLRLARAIQSTYETRQTRGLSKQQSGWNCLHQHMDEARRLRRSLETAQARGWHGAFREIQLQLSTSLRVLTEVASGMRSTLLTQFTPVPSMKEILAELHQLYSEYDSVHIDLKKKTISIQTESITLEEVKLGSFRVRLEWFRLEKDATAGCFEIIALQPNPANNDDNVMHPHVQGRSLCAGDATLPITNALSQGRLADAFHLVLSVLNTYNPHSAYAALADWGGVNCWNCGASTTDNDRYFCEGCDRDMCDDCISSCKHCDRSRCSSCISRCDVCNDSCCRLCLTKSACSDLLLCKDCVRTCEGCEEKVAPEELDDETELCSTCKDGQEEETEEGELVPSPSAESA